MPRISRIAPLAALLLALAPADVSAQVRGGSRVFVDGEGVIRWTATREEVRLFGANYAITSSSDYRAAGLAGGDRKRMIDQDVAHFARMGWDGMRLAFWGDWQAADRQGNLLRNDHLDLLDYLVAKAGERGISILFNPIHTYHAGWPDAMGDTFPGFAAHVPKDRLGTDSAAIAAQVNYVRQILEHVNPYTGVALKDDPAILFVEMINEPVHHPADVAGSVRYIDALVDAVRASGSRAITFHNVSQDFRIGESIRRSKVQGASFGWYPTGLNGGRELRGNHLRSVDEYPWLHMPELAGRPRLVYEFDAADQLTATMYPAMVRTFREGGVQLAAMFAYDMLATSPQNLGWQTHRLNLVYTPRKAMSAVIAAEAMRRLPRGRGYGAYSANLTFGPFRVDPETEGAEMAAPDAFLYAGTTRTAPPSPTRLTRVAGYGSSPVVEYGGEGVYFLDRVRPGVWRLEVYPDAVDVEDAFGIQRRDRVVTRALHRTWEMRITLPDLGAAFSVQPVTAGNPAPSRAADGRFDVRPGVYVLAARGPVDRATLPARIANVDFGEFHAPAADPLPTRVVHRAAPQRPADRAFPLEVRVVSDGAPDTVVAWFRRAGQGFWRPFGMRRAGAYDFRADVPGDSLGEAPYEYVVSVRDGGETRTYPGAVRGSPADWDFDGAAPWRTAVVAPRSPLRLLSPADDAGRLSFSRIGDGYRQGIFRIVQSPASGEAAFHLELPVNVDGFNPEDYTASLIVADRITPRAEAVARATGVRVRLRGIGPRQRLHVTLMEKDGTSWSAPVEVGPEWTERTIPLADLRAGRGVKLPQGYPGTWNYWVGPATGRGGAGDAVRTAEVERLQLSLRREEGLRVEPGAYGVEVESVTLVFD